MKINYVYNYIVINFLHINTNLISYLMINIFIEVMITLNLLKLSSGFIKNKV